MRAMPDGRIETCPPPGDSALRRSGQQKSLLLSHCSARRWSFHRECCPLPSCTTATPWLTWPLAPLQTVKDRLAAGARYFEIPAKNSGALADVLQRFSERGNVVVLGSQEALDEANAERGDWLEITKVL